MKVENHVSPRVNLASITERCEKFLTDKCCSNVSIRLTHEPIPKIEEQHARDWSCLCCSLLSDGNEGELSDLLRGITHL